VLGTPTRSSRQYLYHFYYDKIL